MTFQNSILMFFFYLFIVIFLSVKERKSFMKRFRNSYLSYFLMYSFYYLSWALFSALISVYLMGKGFKASEVSIVVSMSFFTSMLTQPFIGKLNERKDYKIIDSVLFLIAIIGAVAFMLSKSLIMITLTYSLVLVVLNGVNPILEKIATASPFQYGKIRIWGTVGYALGSQFAGILYDKVSPSSIFIVFIFTVLLCILGLCNTEPDMSVTIKKLYEHDHSYSFNLSFSLLQEQL